MKRNDMLFYKTENKKICQRIRIYVIRKKYIEKKLLDITSKTGLDVLKVGFKKQFIKKLIPPEKRQETLNELRQVLQNETP